MQRTELRRLAIFFVTMVLSIARAHGQGSPTISVTDAWARSSAGERQTAIYMTIVNRSERDDELLGASSPAAERIVIERLRIKDLRASRRTVPSVRIPASGTIELSPRDRYLLVSGLNTSLLPGQSIPIVLRFRNSGQIEVNVEATNQELGNRGR